jgi:hypothetical protein
MTAPASAPETEVVDPDGLLGDPTDPPVDDTDAADPPEDAPKDWEAEFKAQQKINRDLERRSKTRLRELEAKLADATKPKPPEDAVPDVAAIRSEIEAKVTADGLRERALDKLETKAARAFQNPEDARTFLAPRVDDFIDGNTIDMQAISDALDDLLTERPYLGVTQGATTRFQGTGDQGAKDRAGKPQLSRAEIESLAKQGRHDEIEKARVEGRLTQALGQNT